MSEITFSDVYIAISDPALGGGPVDHALGPHADPLDLSSIFDKFTH